ncbi:MAG: anti-sigma factor [Gammaproteobacteria bacterium]|nr:anti-sigma factor [Gammaproteobacteria bacterium]
MSGPKQPIDEQDLHAYVDGRLEPARRAEVEAHLAQHADAAERVAAYRHQNETLRALFDPVLAEPVPEALRVPRRRPARPWRYAATLAWVLVGGAAGWMIRGSGPTPVQHYVRVPLPQEAAMAHVVYAPEVLHPVEVPASQEAALVKWLSRRLGVPLRVPHLQAVGFNLMGGRLLPGDRGPAAQFMYQDAQGRRLTLYVQINPRAKTPTAFRYAREDGVSVFYWIDGAMGYALTGQIGKEQLLRAAKSVYQQLEP